MEDVDKPKDIKVVTALKTCNQTLLLTLKRLGKELPAAKWI
jgi:hypothetical protein